MLPLVRSSLHHSESIDPTLAQWIKDLIDDLVGLDATAIVVLLGAVIVAFPLWLALSAARHGRRPESDTPASRPPSTRR